MKRSCTAISVQFITIPLDCYLSNVLVPLLLLSALLLLV